MTTTGAFLQGEGESAPGTGIVRRKSLERRQVQEDAARALAICLVSQSVKELAEKSGPPIISDVSLSHWQVIEGTSIEVTVNARNYNQLSVRFPGSGDARSIRSDEAEWFTATTSGVITVEAANILHGSAVTEHRQIYVVDIPQVNPFSFSAIEVNGMTADDILDLSARLVEDRQLHKDLPTWSDSVTDPPDSTTESFIEALKRLQPDLAADAVRAAGARSAVLGQVPMPPWLAGRIGRSAPPTDATSWPTRHSGH